MMKFFNIVVDSFCSADRVCTSLLLDQCLYFMSFQFSLMLFVDIFSELLLAVVPGPQKFTFGNLFLWAGCHFCCSPTAIKHCNSDKTTVKFRARIVDFFLIAIS